MVNHIYFRVDNIYIEQSLRCGVTPLWSKNRSPSIFFQLDQSSINSNLQSIDMIHMSKNRQSKNRLAPKIACGPVSVGLEPSIGDQNLFALCIGRCLITVIFASR